MPFPKIIYFAPALEQPVDQPAKRPPAYKRIPMHIVDHRFFSFVLKTDNGSGFQQAGLFWSDQEPGLPVIAAIPDMQCLFSSYL
jgi:hypothetical protein